MLNSVNYCPYFRFLSLDKCKKHKTFNLLKLI